MIYFGAISTGLGALAPSSLNNTFLCCADPFRAHTYQRSNFVLLRSYVDNPHKAFVLMVVSK